MGTQVYFCIIRVDTHAVYIHFLNIITLQPIEMINA